MTDRDHFAAAALTGLLASTGKYSNGEPIDYAATAYQFACAMLRERERTTNSSEISNSLPTNHDAVPAAKARTDSATGEPGGGHGSGGTDKPVTRPVLGTGDICQRLRDCETRPLTTMAEECTAVVRDPAAWVELWKTLQDARMEIERLRNGALSVRESVQQEPVAWAVVYPNGAEAIICWRKADAEDMATASDRVEPLYRTPQPAMNDRENLRLLGLIAEIRAAVGDPDGRLMQDELIERCRNLRSEVGRLQDAIRRLAEQDATLSVCDGNVTVTVDGTLTDAEREAIERVAIHCADTHCVDTARTLWGLLARLDACRICKGTGKVAVRMGSEPCHRCTKSDT